MQVDRCVHCGVVDEPYNTLTALFNQECRARGDTVIPNHIRRALVGKNLLLEPVDVHLVVVDEAPGDGVGDGPDMG